MSGARKDPEPRRKTWIEPRAVKDVIVVLIRCLTAIILEWLRQGGRL